MTTVAGNGTAGYAGDGGLATVAQLNHPTGIAIDSAGNLYIADRGNYRVRVVSAGGMITTVAVNGQTGPYYGGLGDGGQATNAQISFADSVAADSHGNLYIADRMNGRMRMVDSNGVITTVAGSGSFGFGGDGGTASSAELNQPSAVAVDSSGNLYIADSGNSGTVGFAWSRRMERSQFSPAPGFRGTPVTEAAREANRAMRTVLERPTTGRVRQCAGLESRSKGGRAECAHTEDFKFRHMAHRWCVVVVRLLLTNKERR